MQILNAQKQAAKVKLCGDAVTAAGVLQKIKKIATLDITEQQIDEVCIFVGLMQLDNERTVDSLQNLFLAFDKLLHFLPDHYVFLYAFQRESLLVLFVSDEVDFPHLAFTQLA